MESVYLLIPLSILIGGIAVWAFFWAVDRGQFDDFEQAERLALEEDPPQTDVSAAASESKSQRS
ncbi:MAG: Cytochrome oxidase maturation protein cbb3-type [Pseudomonadota bacterium]|jgi:cbb3-type cytochrome oxidase maturation protein